MKYIKGLDTLRAFAVIFVIIEHWWLPIDTGNRETLVVWIRGLIPDGGFGVDLFFVLSGYLITGILIDAVQKNPNDKWRIMKNFIIRRSLRIFPVYYVTIFFLLWIGYPDVKEHLGWFLTYTSNILSYTTQSFNKFSHTWSLSVEEQFYLIWPWFIVFVNPKYLKYVFFGALIIGIATMIFTMQILHNWAGFLLMPSCMQAFGIGGLYAWVKGKPAETKFKDVIKQLFPAALLAHFFFTFSSNHGEPYAFLFLTVNSIISVWLIQRVIDNKSEWIRKYFLENTVLNRIGQVSYGIYLFHFVLTPIYEKYAAKLVTWDDPMGMYLLDWKYNYIIRLAILLIIAFSSYHFFEKPVMNLKRFFKY
ncbi:MAG TPA: acyltransferase [Bacteroidia bacterium]|nr:acyltransferase [Bacteroidia bacterium]